MKPRHDALLLDLDGTLLDTAPDMGGALNRFGFFATQPGSLVRYNAAFGALFVEVFDGRLDLQFRNTHGDVVDRFDVQRDCAAPHMLADGGP